MKTEQHRQKFHAVPDSLRRQASEQSRDGAACAGSAVQAYLSARQNVCHLQAFKLWPAECAKVEGDLPPHEVLVCKLLGSIAVVGVHIASDLERRDHPILMVSGQPADAVSVQCSISACCRPQTFGVDTCQDEQCMDWRWNNLIENNLPDANTSNANQPGA